MTPQARVSTHASRITLVLATVALLLFGRLSLRHVGESYFLADQVDQLQKFEAALRLDPEGLWGPAMSGTAARALGPLGAIVFGLPVSLGLGIDAIHALTSLMLAIATGIALWQLLRVDPVLGWIWFIVFISMRMVWWNAAMFWVNTLLLPLGLLLLALFAAWVRRPSWTRVAAMGLVLLLALQVHLVALVGLPIVIVAAARTRRETAGAGAVTIVALMALSLVPYAVAEGRTGFRNTRAMVAHVDSAVHSTEGVGRRAALETLLLATDPSAAIANYSSVTIAVGATIAVAALVLTLARRLPIVWLVGTALMAVIGQALFFLVMARPLNGLHYAMLLAPWYAVPAGALVAGLFPTERQHATHLASLSLGLVAVLLLAFHTPGFADRSAERTPWNYTAIVNAMDMLCRGEAVQTLVGPGLANDLTPGSDSVLQYLLKRDRTHCRYGADADLLIVGNRENSFADAVNVKAHRFERVRVLPPGLALYRIVR